MILFIYYYLTTFLIFLNISISYGKNIEELKDNFFENLRGDPYLLSKTELSDTTKHFIDKQIENFKSINLLSDGYNMKLKKRSLENNNFSSTIEFLPFINIPVENVNDIILLEHQSDWYAVLLDQNGLSVLKYNGSSFVNYKQINTEYGTKLEAFSLESSILIVVLENNDSFSNKSKTKIFKIDADENLNLIQNIDVVYGKDVRIWKFQEQLFMAVTNYKNEHNNYELKTPIYKWLGNHFDIIQYVETSGATTITPIWINEVHMIAVSNSQTNSGDSRIYSDIFKFSWETETFQLHQRILTSACHDIKHFKISSNLVEQHFLVVANSFRKDFEDTINYEINSIIYKYVDDYFIPFQSILTNGISQWEPLAIPNGQLILFGTNLFGEITAYQYNGWNFIKSFILNETSGIKYIHTYNFMEKPVLVVTSSIENKSSVNIFELKNTIKENLEKEKEELLGWCQQKLELLENQDHKIVEREIHDKSKELSNDELEVLQKSLDSLNSDIEELEDKLKVSLQSEHTHFISKNITASTIILNNNALIEKLEASNINDINVATLMENTININNGAKINAPVDFESIFIEESFFLDNFNGHNKKDLVHTSDSLNIKSFNINGDGYFKNNLIVEKEIAGIHFKENNIILNNTNQMFENVAHQSMELDNLETKFLNKINLETAQFDENKMVLTKLESLKAKNLVIAGFINEVDIPTLNKHSLKNVGDQEISGTYFFESLEADNLIVNGSLSKIKVPNAFVLITEGEYDIGNNARFVEDFTADHLNVTRNLNNIVVHNNILDVLIKNSTYEQHITGPKFVEDVQLNNPVNVRGKLSGKFLDKMNPLSFTEEEIIRDDVIISGSIEVEESLEVTDVTSPHLFISMKKVKNDALHINDTNINVILRFDKELAIEEIFADKINNQDPHKWLVNDANQVQVITGSKQFLHNIAITGPTGVFNMNNINVVDLESNMLKQNGDQIISGNHFVKHIVSEHKISLQDLTFGSTPWNEVVSITDEQTIGGTTILNLDLKSSIMDVYSMQINGLINDLNFTEIVNDVVIKDKFKKIEGHKTFANLTTTQLNLINNENMKSKLNMDANEKFNIYYDENLNLPTLSVENIYFSENLNNISKAKFASNSIEKNGIVFVKDDQEFDTMTIYSNAYISSNQINGVDLEDISENSVKVDEPNKFNSVTFTDSVIVDNNVQLKGQIEKLDLDGIIDINTINNQKIYGHKSFKNDVYASGIVTSNGKINGKDFKSLCGITEKLNLNIEGKAVFGKGPVVKQMNNYNVKEILKNAWFMDREANLTNDIIFKNISFKNSLGLTGLMNDVNLNNIANNYFSKTKNQNIHSTFDLTKGVIFENGVATPELTTTVINGINTNDFVQSVLLNDVEQVFENTVYFENFLSKDVKGNYLVNSLNLENEVMLYGRNNIVTGSKTVEFFNVNKLNIHDNILLQNVSVANWMKSIILKNGNFQVSGKHVFKNAVFENGISLQGMLNGVEFSPNTVLLKDIPQNVTGVKEFDSNDLDPIAFKSLKIKGNVNNVDISNLINNQVFKNRHNNITSPMTLNNNIYVTNLYIHSTFNNANVPELLTNISTVNALNNFGNMYNNLYEMSVEIGNSIKDQAYFVSHYKVIDYLSNVNYIFGTKCEDGIDRLFSFDKQNNTYLVTTFIWDETNEQFIEEGLIIDLNTYPTFMEKVVFGNQDYIYMEYLTENSEFSHIGHLLRFKANGELEKLYDIISNGCTCVSSFSLKSKQEDCLVLLDQNGNSVHVLCDNNEKLYLLAKIETKNAFEFTILEVSGDTHICLISNHDLSLEIWSINGENSTIKMRQQIYEDKPRSISSAELNGNYYLVVASGHLQNTMLFGKLTIRKYNKKTHQYEVYQILDIEAPHHVKFSVLPSNELVLYVLTESPSKPFIVYIYNGISGFVEHVAGSTLLSSTSMNTFFIKNDVFVTTIHDKEATILRAMFKGNKIY